MKVKRKPLKMSFKQLLLAVLLLGMVSSSQAQPLIVSATVTDEVHRIQEMRDLGLISSDQQKEMLERLYLTKLKESEREKVEFVKKINRSISSIKEEQAQDSDK
jgi:hypothetical protein